MKKLLCAVFCLTILVSAVAGCGNAAKRELYNVKLSKYVTLGKYDKLSVDTSSDEFKQNYDAQISSDVKNNQFYDTLNEGTVADGDIVNIDYSGTKDGVAFDGGTAQGQELEIGSNSFIDGFESGLIGATIGETVSLNLTFPESYQEPTLAGQAVVFTVKINSLKRASDPDKYYKKLDFKTLKEYEDDVTKRAGGQQLFAQIVKDSKTTNYPEDDTANLYNSFKNQMEQYCQNNYQTSLTDVLTQQGQTEAQFKSDALTQTIKPMMDEQMVAYAILDQQKLDLKQTEIDAKIDEMVKSYQDSSVTKDKLTEYFGTYYFEYQVVNKKVSDYLYENAKIK